MTRMKATGAAMRYFQVLAALVFVAGMAACRLQPVPLSAQAGSTIVIPIAGGDNAIVGYGSSETPAIYLDHQRGAMVYRLDGPDGFELNTRFSIAAETHFASPLAGMVRIEHSWPWGNSPQILSVVNIPVDAPVGTHVLHVSRRLPTGEVVAPDVTYGGQLKILPNSISEVNGEPLGETIVGAPTTGGDPACSMYCYGPHPADAIPRPQIRMTLGGGTIGALEMQLSYPAGVIDIVGATEVAGMQRAPNHAPTVWIEDDGQGLAQISAVAHPEAAGLNSWAFHVVFELDDGATEILDIGDPDLYVANLVAYNLDGEEIPGAGATINGIR